MKTSAERARATRLRKLPKLNRAERKWLAEYDATVQPVGRRATMVREAEAAAARAPLEATPELETKPSSSTPSSSSSSATPELEAPAPPTPTTTPTTPTPEPEVELELDADDDEDDDDEDDDDVRRPNAPSAHAEAECDIPDCSACRTEQPFPICKKTGRKSYPRVSKASATVLAKGVLGAMRTNARIWRADHAPPKATAKEAEELGDAFKVVIERRFPEVGAVDDILTAFALASAYQTRAMFGPSEGARAIPPGLQRPQSAPTPTPAPNTVIRPAAVQAPPAPAVEQAPPELAAVEENEDADPQDVERELERELRRVGAMTTGGRRATS